MKKSAIFLLPFFLGLHCVSTLRTIKNAVSLLGSVFLNEQIKLFQYALENDTEPFNICYAFSKKKELKPLCIGNIICTCYCALVCQQRSLTK